MSARVGALGRLVIGLPTVGRPHDYVGDTLDSVVAGIPADAWGRVEIVILNAHQPPGAHQGLHAALARHAQLARSGRLRVLEGPAGGYAALAAVAGDRLLSWRGKQSLDCATLMRTCADLGDHYLHLEDDVLVAPGFLPALEAWFSGFAGRDDWSALSLFAPWQYPKQNPLPLEAFGGMFGLLLRCRDLPGLAAVIEANFSEAVDYTLRDHLIATQGSIHVRHPSLVDHVGVVSSYGHKLEFGRAHLFEGSRGARLERFLRELVALARRRPGDLPRFLRWSVLPFWARKRLLGAWRRAGLPWRPS